MSATSMTTAWFSSARGEGLVISTAKCRVKPRTSGPWVWAAASPAARANMAAQTAAAASVAAAAGRLRAGVTWRIGGVSFPAGDPALFYSKWGANGPQVIRCDLKPLPRTS